ncbi:MAG: hypothetical protein ACI8SJ_002339 [Shewanella sp.]|jgi:hypothetical protein
MLFDVVYGWRQWRGQRGIWSLLIVSLCLFCSLIAFVINLFWLLSSDRPQWVGNQQPIVTVANKDLSGNLQATSGYDIDLMATIAGVDSVASIAIQPSLVTIGLKELPKLTIGFYSQSAIELLGLSAPFSMQNFEAKKGIVSKQFWRQHFETRASLNESRLYYRDSAFLIAGIAPTTMGRLGDFHVDIWLPDSYLQLGVPDMFADNPDLFLKTESNRYGFALLTQKVDVEQLQDAYINLRQQTPRPEGGFTDKHYRPWIINGVELNPNGRDILQRQAWILLLLLAGFGFIIFSGIVSAYTQQGIARRSEMSLKLALGGCKCGIMSQLMREIIPALVLVGVLSPLLGIVITHYVGTIGVYLDYFSDGFNFNIWLWLVAVFCSLALFICCALMPLSGSMTEIFSRGKQGHLSKVQQLSSRLALVLQLAVIVGVMVVSLSLMYQEIHKYSSVVIADDIDSYKPKVDGRLSIMLTSAQLDGEWVVGGESIALSSQPFTQLGAQSLKYQSETAMGIEKPINGLYVSKNFFSLLGISLLSWGEVTENAVMINQTMASQLATELGLNDWRATKGLALKLSGFYYEKHVRVAGIVSDAPHFGIAKKSKPLVYLSLKDQNPLLASRIAPVFYSKGADKEVTSSHLNDWASLQSPKLSYAKGLSLVQQIEDTDSAGKLLFLTSSGMASLIILLVIFTLYNKFCYAVKSEQIKWAVMLAVGGQKETLMAKMVWVNLQLTLLAMVITFSVFLGLESYSQSLIGVSLFQPLVWGACITLTLLFIISVTLWSAKGLLRQNISVLLRG